MTLSKEGLTKEDKRKLSDVLTRLGLLPKIACQVTLHCADGKVQAVEYSSLKLK